MANYKINLRLNDQQINILYDALQYYSSMGESLIDQYTSKDVQDLLEEISNIYLEEEIEYKMEPAAKAFIEQYGSEELLRNYEKWKGFKAAFDMINNSSDESLEQQLDM
jgi:hypothetical protein